MIRQKLFALLLLLVLTAVPATEGLAQSLPPQAPPAKAKTQRQLVVTLTLPSTIGTVKEYASILFSGNDNKDKKAALKRPVRTSNPVVKITLPLPSSWAAGKDDARPTQQ
ncbi:hypothetical protein [Hymenobacter psychrotolerans]|uniref:Uncharacterized protein n=1 Tax=Hymenobacter psychrotolerans DSM 18569 TaxID=1121959 RepID=A0A1M7GCG7_9BACT|nr:hypothetical protein [Hymenobacter psychrotolerans]SHM13549.1 hypothetical protein SAMN02746009_04001 [Hymenobacter psychrotolerans DSM 18569]